MSDALTKILFDCTKNESHTPKSGFKSLSRRLRNMFKPEKLEAREDFTAEVLSKAGILVMGNPRERFSVTEFDALKQYVLRGGSLLVFAAEGGEAAAGTNINYLLEEFGISINNDCVVRTVHYKYLHPKEAHISDGILNREVVAQVGRARKGGRDEESEPSPAPAAVSRRAGKDFDGTGLDFVYPYGATLTVQKPAIAVLATGKIAYPMNRPLGELAGLPALTPLTCHVHFLDKVLMGLQSSLPLSPPLLPWCFVFSSPPCPFSSPFRAAAPAAPTSASLPSSAESPSPPQDPKGALGGRPLNPFPSSPFPSQRRSGARKSQGRSRWSAL